jgi:hypothetical protein
MGRLFLVLGFLVLAPFGSAFELPRLTSISLVGPATVSPGDTVTLSYRIATGTAPTSSVTFSFYTPISGPPQLGSPFVGTLNITGDSLQGAVSMTITPDWVDGTYQLAEVVANTMYDRSIHFWSDGSAQTVPGGMPIAVGTTPPLDKVRFTVTGATAAYRPPVITGLTRSAPSMLAPGDAATFTAAFTPGSAPLTSLRVVVSDGVRVNIVNLSPLSGGTASGELTPAADWLNGGYLITSVKASDAAGNSVTYDSGGTISDLRGLSLGRHTFNLNSLALSVVNATAPTAYVAPRLIQLALTNGPTINAGNNAVLAFAVTPGTSPVYAMSFAFGSNSNVSEPLSVQIFEVVSGIATVRVPHDIAECRYQLNSVTLVDRLLRSATYDRSGVQVTLPRTTVSEHTFSFPSLDFNVVAAPSGRLVNLAIRSGASTAAQTLILGFTAGGAGTRGTKPLLVRGVGPTLADFGVADALPDPVLGIYSGQNIILANDDWGGNVQLSATASSVGAFALPARSADAALLMTASTAGYSAQITGKNNAMGVALAEVYDATPPASVNATTPRLTNLSARAQVGTSSEILIAGFTISGGPQTLLIRVIGPSLAPFGVADALANPRLAVFSGSQQIAANDDWSGDAALAAAFAATGAFPLATNSRDAGLVVTLPPGSYTAQASGVNGTTGVALIELYELP